MTRIESGGSEQPECWCAYGTRGGGIEEYGREYTEPGCPMHDPDGTPEPLQVLPGDPNDEFEPTDEDGYPYGYAYDDEDF
jgi:hypothetical protein